MMKHAHEHAHADGTRHTHFHGHLGVVPPVTSRDRKEHAAGPHEHEHTARKVTLQITFEVGTLEDIGLGGFKVGWLNAEQDGRELTVTAGAGVGSPYLEASVTGPEGQPSVYARTDIRTLTEDLWTAMRQVQGDLAVLAAAKQEG